MGWWSKKQKSTQKVMVDGLAVKEIQRMFSFFTGEGMTVKEFSHISKPTVDGLPYSL
jgi:hypothetical protein